MIYVIALLVVALIVVMVKVVPMLFGSAAQSELAHVVPGSVSGLPPTLAVAVRKGRGKRRGRANESESKRSDFWRVRGLTSKEWEKQRFDPFYSYLPTNVFHED